MNSNTIELNVQGMTCDGCTRTVQRIIENNGGEQVNVNLESHKAQFVLPDKSRLQEIINSIQEVGYSVQNN